MSMLDGTYYLQTQLEQTVAHHASFERLWETKWKQPCAMGVYPFMFGHLADFQPIVSRLIDEGHREPYDLDAYARAFMPKGDELARRAEEALSEHRRDEASELFLRASAVFRIARFPYPVSPRQLLAWERNKDAARRGLELVRHPVKQVQIPHTSAAENEGRSIPAFYHCPTGEGKAPLVLILTGLDGYRTELAVWSAGWAEVGVATLIMEIPGTGDCPADPTRPEAAERLFDSVLLWIREQESIDAGKVVVWGFSTGGYQTIRLAHTHPRDFLGLVAHGGGCHFMFEEKWLDASQCGEYPFPLGSTLARKFGYGDDFERFKKEGMSKWSLLEDGTLDKPCQPFQLLLVNGYEDSIFPVDDYLLACENGHPKQLRLVRGKGHMGEPESFFIILKWIYGLLGINGNPAEQLKTLPFRARYI